MFANTPINKTDAIREEMSPERIMSVARLVQHGDGKYTEKNIRGYYELDEKKDKYTWESGSMLSIAEELGLIRKMDERYQYIAEPSVIDNYINFRRYVSVFIGNHTMSKLARAIRWFVEANDTVCSFSREGEYIKALSAAGIDGFDDKDIQGWMSWLCFLGYAVRLNSKNCVMPNMAIRIQDAIEAQGMFRPVAVKTGKSVRPVAGKEITAHIEQCIKEIQGTVQEGDYLPLALSTGLMTLHTMKRITLINIPDGYKVKLFRFTGAEFSEISDIKVEGVVYDAVE